MDKKLAKNRRPKVVKRSRAAAIRPEHPGGQPEKHAVRRIRAAGAGGDPASCPEIPRQGGGGGVPLRGKYIPDRLRPIKDNSSQRHRGSREEISRKKRERRSVMQTALFLATISICGEHAVKIAFSFHSFSLFLFMFSFFLLC